MSKKMRRISGIIYGVLAIYEMIVLRYIVQNAAIIDIPIAWLVQLLIMVSSGAMAAWLLAGDTAISKEKRRVVTVITALVVIFQLISYSTQALLMDYAVSMLFPTMEMTGTSIYQLIGMLIRMLLLVLGAFFVQSASEEMDNAEELKEAAEKEMADAEDALDNAEVEETEEQKEAEEKEKTEE